jgi:hypothetical protein
MAACFNVRIDCAAQIGSFVDALLQR